jgi:hypothetical protein
MVSGAPEPGPKGAETIDVFDREVAVTGKGTVEPEGPVTFAQDEDISFLPTGVCGVVVHGFVYGPEHLHNGETRGYVAVTTIVGDAKDILSDLKRSSVHLCLHLVSQ